jgi:hypothetical protein
MERRLVGLGDAPRPGASRKITDEQVEVLVTRTLTEKGHGQDSHWSTRSMAAEAGLSQSSVPDLAGVRPQAARRRDLEVEWPSRRRSPLPARNGAGNPRLPRAERESSAPSHCPPGPPKLGTGNQAGCPGTPVSWLRGREY